MIPLSGIGMVPLIPYYADESDDYDNSFSSESYLLIGKESDDSGEECLIDEYMNYDICMTSSEEPPFI